MMDLTNRWKSMSDTAILAEMGKFVKQHRLRQNITQSKLAKDAGINRSTLVDFEQGKRSNTLTLIQILRALNLMHVFKSFETKYQQSPIEIVKAQEPDRLRAYAPKNKKEKPISDW